MPRNSNCCSALGNLVFKIPEVKEYSQIINAFADYMIVDEPGTKARGGYPNGVDQSIKDSIASILLDGISVIAVDADNSDFICGILVCQLMKREKELAEPVPTYEELKQQFPETHAMLLTVCNDAFPSHQFFAEFPSCHRLMDMYALGVAPQYRTRGIAHELVKRAMQIAQNVGCDGAIITATNKITSLIAIKLNMKHYKSVAWKDYKDLETGKPWFPNLDAEYVDLHFKVF